MKLIKTDFIVTVILIAAWVFYLNYDSSTRFDINKTLTLPLLVAVDFTGLSILYVVGRYYFIKKKGSLFNELLQKPTTDNLSEQNQEESKSEKN